MDVELWKTIPQYPDYEASSCGRIRRVAPTRRRPAGGLLKPAVSRGGYLHVRPYRDGIGFNEEVHALVASAFLGPRPTGHHVNHIDGDKRNNSPSNLEYVTALQNNHHAYNTGLKVRPVGEKNPKAKLTAADVVEIRRAPQGGLDLAKRYGVSYSQIKLIRKGRVWQHLHDMPEGILHGR